MQEEHLAEEEAYNKAHVMLNADLVQDDGAEQLYGPLVNHAVSDEAAQLYMASVKDSLRDQKQLRALLKQIGQES